MRQKLLLLACLLIVNLLEAQNKLIRDSLVGIGKMKVASPYNCPTSKIVYLLNLDVVGYNELEEKYDTELKRKFFQKSEEYKRLLAKMKLQRNKLLQKDFYTLIGLGEYNVKTRCFETGYSVLQGHYADIPGYKNFDESHLFNFPIQIKHTYKGKGLEWGIFPAHYFSMSIPFTNEKAALEIEENIKECALVIVFKAQKGINIKSREGVREFTNGLILGKTSNVYLANLRTGHIYKKWDGGIKQMAKYELSEKEVQRQILAEKAAEKQKIMKRQAAEEQKRQEKRKREEEVRRLLTTTNHQDIKTKIDSICNSKLLTELKQWDASIVLYGHYPAQSEIEIETKFWIRIDSLHSEIVKIDDNVIDNHYSWLSEHIKTPYCTVDNENYYKHNNDIFYRKQITIEGKFEKEIYGVKNQNGRFKFYKTTPDTVQKWCQKNITTNGFHAVEYVHYNDSQSIIKLITVDKTTKKLLQGKNPEKAKKVWGSIGGAAILLLCLLLI